MIILTRTGRASLRFGGELLAESEGQHHRGRDQTRWHDIAIYQAEDGTIALAIAYETRYQGEGGYATASVHETPASVAATLAGYDPTARVAGFPPGGHYAEKQHPNRPRRPDRRRGGQLPLHRL